MHGVIANNTHYARVRLVCCRWRCVCALRSSRSRPPIIRFACLLFTSSCIASQVSYAPPVLSSVEVFVAAADGTGCGSACAAAPAGAVASTLLSPGSTIRLPTAPTLVRLRGTNLGTSPLLFTGDISVQGAAAGIVSAPCPPSAFTAPNPAPYSCVDFISPAGEGTGRKQYPSTGAFPLYLVAGNQASATWAMSYAPPMPVSVLPFTLSAGTTPGGASDDDTAAVSDDDGGVSTASPYASFPTRGGTGLYIIGVNFGYTPPLRTSSLRVSLFSTPLDAAGVGGIPAVYNATHCSRVNQTVLACVLPPGAGARLSVRVSIADQSGASPVSLLAYDPPAIAGIALNSTGAFDRLLSGTSLLSAGVGGGAAPGVNSTPVAAGSILSGATSGGTIITITGANFGRGPSGTSRMLSSSSSGNGSTGFCVFLSWSFRPMASPVPLCNGLVDFIGEGEQAYTQVLHWDHERIVLNVTQGAGVKDVIVSAQGGSTIGVGGAASPSAPSVNTAGLTVFPPPTFRFAYAPPVIASLTPSVDGSTGGGDLITLSGFNFGPTPRNTSIPALMLTTAPVPSSGGLNVPLTVDATLPSWLMRIRFGGACLSDVLDEVGARVFGLPAAAATCAGVGSIVSHSHTQIVFRLPPGVGAGINVSVELVTALAPTGPLYLTPASYITPAPALFSYAAPSISSFSPALISMFGAPTSVTIRGADFGSAGDAVANAYPPAILIGGLPCTSSARLSTGDASYGGTVLTCGLGANTPAGPRNVSRSRIVIVYIRSILHGARRRVMLARCRKSSVQCDIVHGKFATR